MHPETATNTKNRNVNCLKNTQQATFLNVFTDPQIKSVKLSFLTPDCRCPPSTALQQQRSSSFSSGLVPTQLTLPTQAQAVNPQDSREWRLPTSSSFILGGILSSSSCCLQIPPQEMRTTAGNRRAQWQKATVWLSVLVHLFLWC